MIYNFKTNIMKEHLKKILLLLAFLGLSGLNAQATNYYTFTSGDWSTPGIWTTDPTGLTSVAPAIPGASDAVFVINNKVVTNTVTARTVTATFIQSNATLDLGIITGNNLGTVSGSGLIKLSSTSFPLGTFTSFVSATGGTIEYYNVAGVLPSISTYNNLKIDAYFLKLSYAIGLFDMTLMGMVYLLKLFFKKVKDLRLHLKTI